MPRHIVVDTGPLVALFDGGDRYHGDAVRFVQETRAELLSNVAVVTEVMYLLAFDRRAQKDFLRWVADGAMTLVQSDHTDIERVLDLMNKYADLPMDFTDGLLVAMCERLGVKHVATVDDDFTIYRFQGRGRFFNVFESE
jgi:predicted nucleic acid-binding protein